MGKVDFTQIDFKISSNTASAAFHSLANYITDFSGINLEALTQESHALGDAWEEFSPTGLKRVQPITIGGFYDDVAASGPAALLGNATDLGSERVVKVNMGTTNAYHKTKVIIKRFSRKPTRGELTKYEVEFLPSSGYSVVAT